jgi:hypothetical protein
MQQFALPAAFFLPHSSCRISPDRAKELSEHATSKNTRDIHLPE